MGLGEPDHLGESREAGGPHEPGERGARAGPAVREAGMVTAEIAVALPALVLALTLGLGAVTAVTDHLRCVDAARTGARLLARGEDPGRVQREMALQAPRGARIVLEAGTDSVRAEVRADLPAVLSILGARAAPRGVAYAIPEVSP